MKRLYRIASLILLITTSSRLQAQTATDTGAALSLDDCIRFAYKHNPGLQQTLLDRDITEHGIRSRLADWYPQISFDYNIQHYFELQQININGNLIRSGLENTSLAAFSATQNLFNSDVLLASNTAKQVRRQANQNIISNKIDVTVNVGKAFYNVLLTQEQLKVLDENITRLDRNLKQARDQYEGGITDKVDYKRATIALNNTKAQRKTAEEVWKAKMAYLKMQMGYPDSVALSMVYDSVQLHQMAVMDTLTAADPQNRIEYQLLRTTQQLQHANYNYYKWKFLPTVQAFGNYNLSYLNNDFDKLYNANYPYSFAGLKVSLPLFQGLRRLENMKQAKLQLKRVDYDLENLNNNVSAEYAQAMSVYKGNLNDYYALQENVAIARDVFNTIELQYKAGIKTYLELITAQTDLRTSELNYTNALYQLLGARLDVERARGTITPQYFF
jgi:outer membrane protein